MSEGSIYESWSWGNHKWGDHKWETDAERKNKNTGLYNLVLGNYLPAEDRQIVIGGF